MDFSKLYCPLHPKEVVTNYCAKQECQVGLCANCVCIHTKIHLEKGSSPLYENIRLTYQRLVQSIQARANELEDVRNRISQVEAKASEKKEKLKQIVRLACQETISFVNEFFQSKEKALMMQMDFSDKKSGLHCQPRLQKLKTTLQSQIQNLFTVVKNTNSYNFLQILPRIKMQELHNSREVLSCVAAETRANQIYNTSISYNKSILNVLENELHKVISIRIGNDVPNGNTYGNIKASNPSEKINWPKIESKVQEQSNLFTLRRPSSQSSIATVEFNQRVYEENNKNQFKFKNVFDLDGADDINAPHPSESTLKMERGRQGKRSETDSNEKDSESCNSTSGFRLQQVVSEDKLSRGIKETVLSQLPNNNYNFTFGSQVQEYNPFSRPNRERKYQDYGSISRVSQKWKSKCDKLINPGTVSDLQGKRISSNIKRMEEKSKNKIQNSYFSNFDEDVSQGDNSQKGNYVYRTQFL